MEPYDLSHHEWQILSPASTDSMRFKAGEISGRTWIHTWAILNELVLLACRVPNVSEE